MRTNKNANRKISAFKLITLTSTALVGLAISPAVQAQQWTGATDGDWFKSTNWIPAQIPASGDDVKIDAAAPPANIVSTGSDGATHNITIGESQFGDLRIENGGTLTSNQAILGDLAGSEGRVDLGSFGSITESFWTNSASLTVGNSGFGSLTISLGTISNTDGTVGANAGSGGFVGVSGANSTWTNNGFLTVGGAGEGQLTISNGGTVSNTGVGTIGDADKSIGGVSITGAGSSWTNSGDLIVGNSGTGTLDILDRAHVTSNGGTIAANAGSIGTVTVDGPATAWNNNNGDMTVGYGGDGTLNITNGGQVSDGVAVIGWGEDSQGTVLVSGGGSTWTNGSLSVGDSGAGTLNLANGGSVSNLDGAIGAEAGSHGTVTVDGENSSWTNEVLRVGDSGVGDLTITNGGTVHDAVGALAVSDDASSGHVTVDGPGSSWVNEGGTIIGINGTGILNIANGGRVDSGVSVVGANAILGSAADSLGVAAIEGAGSTWNVVNDLVVGSFGNGTLRIDSGATVSVGGELVLAEDADSTGGLSIGGAVPGTLDAATVRFGAGVGRINFDHTNSNYNFDAAINGLGTLNQANGVTHLTADSSGFTGSTHVKRGTLFVDGKLGTGAIDVVTGATLGGKGLIGGAVSVASGGTLSGIQGQTLTMQDLELMSGANVDVTLSTPGGAALFDVTGGLTLDGSLNITSAGAFGPGVYALMTYGGDLTGSGLDIGTTPGGTTASDFAVQTSVTGQINLVDTALPSLTFWDGDAAGSADNNAVDGGSGTWSATSTNWTDLNGTANGAMRPQPGFAVFQNTAGTVTVDGSAGDVAVTGMQFASDGYRVTGAAITLADANSIFRVGNGQAAGSDFTATIGSVLTGTGGLEKTDLGTLILTGDNDCSGGTTITDGTLQLGNGGTSGSIAGDIVNNGALKFDRSDVSTFAGDISGYGTIWQNGAGTINLTGDSSGFTGAVNVNGGRLAVNGSLAGGQVTVGNGGTLGGNGVVGSLTAQSGSIVAPGNSIGTLSVAGNASFAAGSTYQVELGADGQSDLFDVAGSVVIADGAQLSIIKAYAAPYVPGTHYKILTAAGGVSGEFGFDAVQLTNFIGLAGSSDANAIYLDVARTKTFASAGVTANQAATGGALDALPPSNSIADAVANLPTDASAQAAFNQLSSEVHASARGGMIEDSRFVRDAALDRLRDAFDGVDAASATIERFAVWGRGFGAWGKMDGDSNAATLKHDNSGFLMGADGLVGETWRVGVLGGYSRSTFHDEARNASGESDNYNVGAFAGAQWGEFAFRSGLAYTWHDLSTSRSVSFAGFADTLSGDYKAGTAQAFGELGYSLKSGRMAFEPFANIAYVGLSTDGFTEKGGAAALTGKSDNTGVAFTTLGSRAASTFALDNGWNVTARGSLGWRHAFGDTTPQATMAFAGGSAFNIGGVPIAEDSAVVDLGVDVNISDKVALGVSYGGQFGAGSYDHTVRASFVVKF